MGSNKDVCCKDGGYCFCKASLAAAIIAIAWIAPDWSKIAITILAALIILGAGTCFCRIKK